MNGLGDQITNEFIRSVRCYIHEDCGTECPRRKPLALERWHLEKLKEKRQ